MASASVTPRNYRQQHLVATIVLVCYGGAMKNSADVLWDDVHPADWRRWLLAPIIPKGEHGDTRPLSIAFPRNMIARIDRVARETRNNRSDAIRHLLRWALDAYEKSREKEAEDASKSA